MSSSFLSFFRTLLSAWQDFIYPPHCLHCHAAINPSRTPIFCEPCLELVQLLDIQDQCPSCFLPRKAKSFCSHCQKQPTPYYRMAAAFEYEGPMASLIHALKYGGQFYLAEGAAAYLAAQWLQLNWEKPDFIVPVPISTTHYFSRGYNQSLLIARSLGALLSIPILDLLHKTSDSYSQAGLNRTQRQQLTKNAITLKKPQLVLGAQLLVVDDVMTSQTTLKRCAQALLEGGPDRLYALTLCRA